jgi:hypothetical protein
MQTWVPDAWQHPDSNQLAELRLLRAQIDAYLSEVRELRSEPDTETFEFVFGDASVLAAITGERGGGKSSLLGLMCRALRERGVDLVVPTLRPEFFSATDTLVTALFSALWSAIANGHAAPEWLKTIDDEQRSRLARQCLTAARSYAVSQTPSSALNVGSHAAVDYAEESLAVSRSTPRSHLELAHFVTELLGHAAPACRPLIVVPVDDADLAPAQIGRILHDLRFIASIPGVVAVACFDFADLRSEWLAARALATPGGSPRELTERLERELEKLFPQRARFNIPILSASARRSFAPIGEREPLSVRWDRVVEQIEVMVGRSTSLEVVTRNAPYPHGLVSPLPSTPRSLIQLWEALEPAESTQSDAQDLLFRVNRAIELVAGPLRFWCLDNQFDEPRMTLAQGAVARPTVDTRLPRVSIGISADRAFPDDTEAREAPRQRSTLLRTIAGVYMDGILEPVEVQAGRSSLTRRLRMPDQAAAALLALQDVALSAQRSDDWDRPPYFGLDEWRFLQRTALPGGGAVETLASLPCGAGLGQIVDLIEIWNTLVIRHEFIPLTRQFLQDVVVASVHHGRGLGASTLTEALSADTEADYDAALQTAADTFAAMATDGSARAWYFRQWFKELLPLQWHTEVFTTEEIGKFVSLHQASIAAYNVPAAPEIDPPADEFERAIRLYLARPEHQAALSGYAVVAEYIAPRLAPTLSKLSAPDSDELAAGGAEARSQRALPLDVDAASGLLEQALRALDEHRAPKG